MRHWSSIETAGLCRFCGRRCRSWMTSYCAAAQIVSLPFRLKLKLKHDMVLSSNISQPPKYPNMDPCGVRIRSCNRGLGYICLSASGFPDLLKSFRHAEASDTSFLGSWTQLGVRVVGCACRILYNVGVTHDLAALVP